MDIKSIYKKSFSNLKYKKIPTPNLDVEAIISFVLKKNKEFLFTYPEHRITAKQKKIISSLIKKRGKGFPLAYLINSKFFFGLDFSVGQGVLIPRPETEIIVQDILETDFKKKKEINIIDLGTGSGCLAITLAKLLNKYENISFWGVDKYAKPLKYACLNAEKHKQTKVKFIRNSLLNYFLKNTTELKEFNLITANLPYLTRNQFKHEKSIQKEPRTSLISPENGLKHYRELFRQIARLKSIKSEANYLFYCEINPEQVKDLEKLSQEFFKPEKLLIKKDLAGLDRVIKIKI